MVVEEVLKITKSPVRIYYNYREGTRDALCVCYKRQTGCAMQALRESFIFLKNRRANRCSIEKDGAPIRMLIGINDNIRYNYILSDMCLRFEDMLQAEVDHMISSTYDYRACLHIFMKDFTAEDEYIHLH